MQDVKHFINGRDLSGEFNITPLEVQINSFLENNPNYSVHSFSTIMGPSYKEAFVVFDVKGEQTEKPRKQAQAQKAKE